MSDFNVRADSVNVEQIMEQIRARIREKRGVDYTEQQIRELAAVKLEKFLDPRGVRSDLLEHFKARPAYEGPDLPNYSFEDETLFETHRAPIRWIRRLLKPLLKLLFNPNPLIQALHIQARLNAMNLERENAREMSRRAMDQLYYELVHNMVVETTRTGIEVKNLKMRVESISSRLEFNERRARALEGVVVYKPTEADEPPAPRPAPQIRRQPAPASQPQQRHAPSQPSYRAPAPVPSTAPAAAPTPAASQEPPSAGQAAGQTPGQTQGQAQGQAVPGDGPGQRSRRRRRRRGRRSGGAASAVMGGPDSAAPGATADAPESADAVDPMDTMDQRDDEGSPEPEEIRAAAAEPVEPAAGAESRQADPRVEPFEPRVEQPEAQIQPSAHADAAPAAATSTEPAPASPAAPAPEPPAAPAPAPPATLDHADPDPQ
jgi:hypothetical protein